MAKLLHETISASEKLASLTDLEFRVWTMLLPLTDAYGRFPANEVLVKAQAMPLCDVRPAQVMMALERLAALGLIHLYGVGQKRHLVYHDHDDYNPSRYLKNRRAKWPVPPSGLCECLESDGRAPPNDVENGVRTPFVRRSKTTTTTPTKTPGEERVQGEGGTDDPLRAELRAALGAPLPADLPPDEVTRQLLQEAKLAKCPNNESTQRRYIEALRAREDVGAERLLAYLRAPIARGVDVLAWQQHFDAKNKTITRLPKPQPPCPKCKNRGLVPVKRNVNGQEIDAYAICDHKRLEASPE